MGFRRLPITLLLVVTTLLVSACDFFGADQADQAPPAGQAATADVSAAPVVDRTDGTLPLTLAEMALGSSDQPLLDIVYDPDANQIYATDAAGLLYIVDAKDYSLRATLPAAGKITVDAARHRLFVAPNTSVYQESPQITVVDTSAFTVTHVISGSGMTHLAFDPAQNRLYLGKYVFAATAANTPNVQILDGDTFAPVGEMPAAGVPVFNPRRNELLIVASTVYVADPVRRVLTWDLFPEISRQECLDCTGGLRANAAYVLADENLLAIDVQLIATSGGGGAVQPPRFYDATTLAPLTDLADQPVLQATCGSRQFIQPHVDDRVYRHTLYARYVLYNNLNVFDQNGAFLNWYDGIARPFVNANTQQLYAGGWTYALPALQPIGVLPSGFCVYDYDAQLGVLFGARRNLLTVMAEHGAPPGGQPNEDVATLPPAALPQIVVSPAYANDRSVYVVTSSGSIFRTLDDGASWRHLRNGLFFDGLATVTLAASPNFAADQTLFAGGYVREALGGGVFRSTDGGESWQPAWQGLNHLRVDNILLSPAYAADQTLVAHAHYDRINPWQAGESLFQSADGGANWTLAFTSTNVISTALQASLLPAPTPQPNIPLRKADYDRTIEVTTDNGATWQRVDLGQPESATVLAIAPAPANQASGLSYVLGQYGLWRVRDNGATIEQWADPRLAGRTYTNTLLSLAVSPQLADGGQRLFVGTFAGEFWSIDPAAASWQPFASSAPTPTAAATVAPVQLPTPTPTPQPVTPPTVTPLPVTPAPLPGEPPPGRFRPSGRFADLWAADENLQRRLGYARSEQATEVSAALETFEQGLMLWRGDELRIYAIYSDGTWDLFDDTFREGEAELDPSITPPADRLQPIRGFGKVWRSSPQVRAGLGWATDKEDGLTAVVQVFDHGSLVRLPGLIYALVLEPDGRRTWTVVG